MNGRRPRPRRSVGTSRSETSGPLRTPDGRSLPSSTLVANAAPCSSEARVPAEVVDSELQMASKDALAIDGGTPVRSKRLPLGRGIAVLGDEEREAVLEVLESRSLFRYYGPKLLNKVATFEQTLASELGCAHALAASSGTAALRAGLAALGVGCGDEAIVPSFTFIATVNAVVAAGAVPVFCEVDRSLNADPQDVAAKITDKTTAVMPVHLENQGCDMDALLDVTRSRGVAVIEDACQAIGSSY